MLLKVIEEGVPKDVPIKQGEIFLLPARIEHSPQRFANTVGCVIERTRKDTEFDCLRYFVPNTTEVLWERWFHLEDVVKDLPPRIKEFFGSHEFKTNQPGKGSKLREAPFQPRQLKLPAPINLSDFIEKHMEEIK
ncbi:Protein HAAO-1 [Aphelenchoides avenae]|nr:Protein HAAO-1 [Aphelenchus avenae]